MRETGLTSHNSSGINGIRSRRSWKVSWHLRGFPRFARQAHLTMMRETGLTSHNSSGINGIRTRAATKAQGPQPCSFDHYSLKQMLKGLW